MKKRFIGTTLFLVAAAVIAVTVLLQPKNGTEESTILPVNAEEPIIEVVEAVELEVVFPIDGYATHRTFKGFGEYVDDRFTGYHVAEDIEVDNVGEEIPVFAIADGTILYAGDAGGYGGVIIITHVFDDKTVTAIYGHLDMKSSTLVVGDSVTRGQTIAMLGDHESDETDGARKHLHFGMYEGTDLRFSGYVKDAAEVSNWMNPGDFFVAHGLEMEESAHEYDSAQDQGADVFDVAFEIPAGWDVEYIPSIEALNLYTLSGEGTARERSQIFIRYFDAAEFLTLSTVKIYSTEDLTVGTENYTARRYDIEKNDGVANFADQPTWRNDRHIVTDFRAEEGFARYYVVASNPELDSEMYEVLLGGIRVIK